MSRGVTAASSQSYIGSSAPPIPSKIRRRCPSVIPPASRDRPLFPSNFKPISSGLLKFPRIDLGCGSTGGSGENVSKTVLDAFFLGKAVGEALNERIESSVGEFLSIIGRLQSEQQKQVLEFQEEVLEKARRASREAMEAKGLVSKSTEAMEAQGLVSKSTSLSASTVNGVTDSVISTEEDPFFGLIGKD